ncbi:hypothetical protein MA16_Dca022296 [Dendrobium catenatum]|uniref:Uncharacterized protein n=1 Tax=Dendrobium catenatum TaxID=906689 RepID=A0A2I0XAY5_9ASPA|nr:hypothetical protein MA16_Dca022296 [Dendrobium catenatum]
MEQIDIELYRAVRSVYYSDTLHKPYHIYIEEVTKLRHCKRKYAELETSQKGKKQKRRLEKMKYIEAYDD